MTASVKCKYCLHHRSHPYFCYILTDRRFTHNKKGQKDVAKIGVSRHPIHRLHSHNRRDGYKTGRRAKSTKACSGFYQIEFIVGPFSSRTAAEFERQWNSARKVIPRMVKGLQLATRYKRTVGARDEAELTRFARKHLL